MIYANIIPKVVDLFKTDVYSVKKEAAWVLANALTSSDTSQIDYLIDKKAMDVFLDILRTMPTDAKMTQLALESIEKLLILSKIDTDEPNEHYASLITEMKSKKNRIFLKTLLRI